MAVTSSPMVTLCYQDLLDFKNCDDNEDDNAQRLMEQIGQAYGSEGLGILSVSGVPGFLELRQRLLPLAAQIPKLPKDDLNSCISEESCYSVGWSHGKEELTPGVPDLSKGSYYANPLVNDLCEAMLERRRQEHQKQPQQTPDVFQENLRLLVQENPSFFAPNVYPASLPDLEAAFADMGQCIAKVGRLVSCVAEAYCEKHDIKVNLEEILTDSLNCKARLLHYFAPKDQLPANGENNDKWWCGWHNDHGALTGLVPAMYLAESEQKQLSNPPDPKAGLYIQSRKKELVKISLPSDCIGFQIGETFQILSGGLLQATPHAVRQALSPAITRETFAVFMEPEFEFPLALPRNRTIDDCCSDEAVNESLKLNSIKSRWTPGMNFGTFHNVTVKTFHHFVSQQ